MKIFKLFFVALALIILSGCSKNPISVVKTSCLVGYQNRTIGDAFYNYDGFLMQDWELVSSKDGVSIIQFDGLLNEDWDLVTGEQPWRTANEAFLSMAYIAYGAEGMDLTMGISAEFIVKNGQLIEMRKINRVAVLKYNGKEKTQVLPMKQTEVDAALSAIYANEPIKTKL